MNEINRRQFFKSAGFFGLALSTTASRSSKADEALWENANECTRPLQLNDFSRMDSLNSDIRDVIVVGGGIAGLTAALALKKAKRNVIVFESAPNVGGRMSTKRLDNRNLDRAAQVIIGSYKFIPQLLEELNLKNSLISIRPEIGFQRNGKLHPVNPAIPTQLLTSGLIAPWEMNTLGVLFGLKRLTQILATSQLCGSPQAWSQFDNEVASNWSQKTFGKALSTYLFEPSISSLYFQELDQTSVATLASMGTSVMGQGLSVVKNGIGSIPEEAAKRLDVKTSVTVNKIESLSPNRGLKVETSIGEYQADAIVLATPAPIAKTLYHSNSPEEIALLNTTYQRCMTVIVALAKNFVENVGLDRFNAFLTNKLESEYVYMAECDSSNVYNAQDPRSKNEVTIKFLIGDNRRHKPSPVDLFSLRDEEIVEIVLKEVERYVPGIKWQAKPLTVERFNHGMPNSGLGRYSKILDYRNSQIQKRIALAGDYTSYITTNGAAESGMYAVKKLLT